jgi:hypothetical protein
MKPNLLKEMKLNLTELEKEVLQWIVHKVIQNPKGDGDIYFKVTCLFYKGKNTNIGGEHENLGRMHFVRHTFEKLREEMYISYNGEPTFSKPCVVHLSPIFHDYLLDMGIINEQESKTLVSGRD